VGGLASVYLLAASGLGLVSPLVPPRLDRGVEQRRVAILGAGTIGAACAA
jgi:hypothetical protein